jgi:signal transduction histidine kinase
LELQRMINELEAFSYTVSHDLRAPLRAMQGYSNALLEDFSEKWSEEERDLLVRINRAAQRLDILIQDVLTYSKVNKERQAVIPVELDRLVPDILSQYPTFQDPKLKIEVQHPLAVVLGHESGLTQVISNVLTNAIKFTNANRVPEIKIWTESTEFRVRLWIQDNGIGVDQENHTRIFKMFEQVDSKSYEGTGIGLAIAKKAVENMHGAIGIESKLGEGTRVWIELLKPGNA